jgi:hypothetical protein
VEIDERPRANLGLRVGQREAEERQEWVEGAQEVQE